MNSSFFFFNDTATTEIYTLSLHDALPIFLHVGGDLAPREVADVGAELLVLRGFREIQRHRPALLGSSQTDVRTLDRKSTRLNSSHANISYAVFCLKTKNNTTHPNISYNTL